VPGRRRAACRFLRVRVPAAQLHPPQVEPAISPSGVGCVYNRLKRKTNANTDFGGPSRITSLLLLTADLAIE
jgi:hypothetical protein